MTDCTTSNFPFSKFQGAGNDFVVLDGRRRLPFEPSKFAIAACDRHFGVGGDGLVILEPSQKADFRMVFFNPDGSRAICGNGMRCLARFIAKLGLLQTDQKEFDMETDAGVVHVEIIGKGDRIRVDMGIPTFEGPRIPTAKSGEHIASPLLVDGKEYLVTTVGMGNPHCVLFVDDVHKADVRGLGPRIENHAFFPERTNVEFVQVVGRKNLIVRVWERGAGETLACGTGFCASLAASVREGRVDRKVALQALGGDFEVSWNEKDNHISLLGPAEEVFSGKLNVAQLMRRYDPAASGTYESVLEIS